MQVIHSKENPLRPSSRHSVKSTPPPKASARECVAQKNAPAVHTGRGIFLDLSESADVHEAQAAPGLNVPVAISADVEGRAAEEAMMAVTVMTMTVVATVHAMPAMAMTATSRSRGHSGSTERDSGGDSEGNLAKHFCSPCEVQCTGYAYGTHPKRP
jgi:hypothetical protein